MEFTENRNGSNCEISFSGKFTFSDHESFRSIIGFIKTGEFKSFILDMSEVEFVDSAALGMLLIAKEEAEKKSIDLVIKNPQGQVEKMFKVSKFDTMFKIK